MCLDFRWANRSFALIACAVLTLFMANASSSQPIRLSSQGGYTLKDWQFQRLGDSTWTPCQVPSYIQDELITRGTLPNPHYRDQEQDVQWVDKEDWIYQTVFTLTPGEREAGKQYFLELDGVDTYSDIYLNGAHIGRTESMFVGYRFDISPYLLNGANRLSIHLVSPLKKAHAQYLSNGFNYPADNDHAPIRYSPFVRKAPYHYGWDWGMRLVGIGLYKKIRLKAYEGARLESVGIATQIDWDSAGHASQAHLHLSPEIERLTTSPIAHCLEARLIEPNGKVVGQSISRDRDNLTLQIDRPHLWYPNGWGEPFLYRLEVDLKDAHGKVIDQWQKEIGIREIKFVNEPDQWGTSFYWLINRKPIFIKGANYIPGELLLTRRDRKTFTRLMDDVVFANMNMIRVWGGGIYEDEAFYNEADRRGILVWQDFMFACTAYPSDSAFLRLVEQEAIYQLKRLRHHACIALWCGNNEVEEAIKYWGWDKKYSAEVYAQMRSGYDPLFRSLLPRLVQTHAPTQSYIHGSPMQANWGRPHTFGHGDSHYWGLWYGREPFEVFREKKGMRFVSEFGFQSLPSWQTIRDFTLEEDRDLHSPVMTVHQKASTGNGLILDYMKRYYRVPNDFEHLVYASQVLQARGMEEAIRTLRSQRPTCMGALYWQLNDAWPALSWSSIDYHHNYKALHYTARRAFAPITILTQEVDSDSLAIYIANDKLEAIQNCTLEIRQYTPQGLLKQTKRIRLDKIASNSLSLVARLSRLEWGVGEGETSRLISMNLRNKGESIRLEYYPCPTKDLALAPEHYNLRILSQRHGIASVELSSPVLLKDVCLSLPWHGVRMSDNCFDLLPGEKRIITIHHAKITSTTPLNLHLETMNRLHHLSVVDHNA